jgi:hypothetical protein
MPEDTTPDDGGQVNPLGETTAVLCVGQDIKRERQATPHQHHDQAVLPQDTDQTVERHGRDMGEHRTQLQTETPVRGQQYVTGAPRNARPSPRAAARMDMCKRARRMRLLPCTLHGIRVPRRVHSLI